MASDSKMVAEPKSGFEYSREIEVDGDTFKLVGLGLRTKTIGIFPVQVYSLGFYIETQGLAKFFKYENWTFKELSENQEFFDVLRQGIHVLCAFVWLFLIHF